MQQHFVLGIDTSDFEPTAGIVVNGNLVSSDVRASEFAPPITDEQQFDTFVSLDHLDYLDKVVQQALENANLEAHQLDCIAVTQGPGQMGNLELGINFARGFALATGKPLIGVHLLEGNIFSAYLNQATQPIFPTLALVASGLATEIVLVHELGHYEQISRTLDDTAGETIDKVGNVLNFPFPAGSYIEQAARLGNPLAYPFDRLTRDDNDNFSFNNLKLGILNQVTVEAQKQSAMPDRRSKPDRVLKSGISINDVAASLQHALTSYLVDKTVQQAKKLGVDNVIVVGDLSANQSLRKLFTKQTDLNVRFPNINYAQNNGAMIAAAGYFNWEQGYAETDFSARPRWELGNAIQRNQGV